MDKNKTEKKLKKLELEFEKIKVLLDIMQTIIFMEIFMGNANSKLV